MGFMMLNEDFEKGDIVVTKNGHYYVFESYNDTYEKCNIYGIELSELKDHVDIVHASVPTNSLVHGNVEEINSEGDLAIIRDYILNGQSFSSYREATTI